MYALDFEYDGHYLSDFGFIICDFNGSSGAQTATIGSNITFNTVSRRRGTRHSLISTQYGDRLQTKFHICKDPELHDDMMITNSEYRDLMRWLNRNEFLKFQVLYEYKDDTSREPCYFNASFNIAKVTIGDVLYGLELNMETDRPFGYGEEQICKKKVLSANSPITFYDTSDEFASSYVSMKIICADAGDIVIRSSPANTTTVIKNCAAGEEIFLDGDTLIITTSRITHKICQDFNFVFPKIHNSHENNANKITISLPCSIEIKYTPIIKDIP